MDSASTGILCICCAALGLTLAEQMISAERFQKQIRLVMTVLLLTVIFTRLHMTDFSGLRGEIAEGDAVSAEIAETAERARAEAVAEQIINGLNRALEAHEAPCQVEEIDLHIPADGGIVINRAVLSGNLLTGTVYLREWLGGDVMIEAKEVNGDAG